MVKSLDNIPYGEMPKWEQTARFLINAKQKLGLGLQTKKGKTALSSDWVSTISRRTSQTNHKKLFKEDSNIKRD